MNTFCNNLKFLREHKHLSQKDLAAFLNISVNSYQRYEYGTREPNLVAINQLASFFNVPTDFLLGHGVFFNWIDILNNKDVVIDTISNASPQIGIFLKNSDDITVFIKVLSALIEKIVIDSTNQQVLIYYSFNNLIQLEPTK